MTEEEFRAAEKSLRASFPKAYKRLLHKKNPAEIGEWIFFPIREQGRLQKTWDDVTRQNSVCREESMPDDMIVIADNGTGDKPCLKKADGVMEETVYLWDHETAGVELYAAAIGELIENEKE
ncbi:SMI1/KNR4 family protein [Bacillus amyloliquefaciens]|uniref:SMI1/KNR4 family protein n=1 Tax=Bacillus amyloliquefaciens TaxID=1390 RepID=UPI0022B064AF|nr:SMI1/KNR4 family protein [Bacillus amyloliquefaciens]MCZ4247458.1 SMI1/KNR4 family protein [Bacillus amyloliquefaciens]